MVEVLSNVVVKSIKLVVLAKLVFSLDIVDSLVSSKLVVVDEIPFVWLRLVERLLIAVCVVDSMFSVTPVLNVGFLVDEPKKRKEKHP